MSGSVAYASRTPTRLNGHSDADVVLHALTDALLAAIGDGDIGTHFPPSEARWKGASSDIFLRHAVGLVRARGGANREPQRDDRLRGAQGRPPTAKRYGRGSPEIAGIAVDRIGVTATTSEKMGFTGRGEGIVSWGLATIRLPESAA